MRWAEVLEHVHPDDRPRVQDAVRRTLESRGPWDLEHRIVRPDGSVREVRQLGDPSRDERGRVLRIRGTIQDVTDARSTQRGLAQSEATLRSLFASSQEAMVLLDDSLNLISFNEAATRLAQAGGEHLVAGERLSSRAREYLEELLEKALRGDYAQLERRIAGPSPRWLDLSASPVYLQNGTIAGLTLVCRDVTERHVAEEQLRHSQKMETVGQLAGGIAHDFNNLLTMIISAASGLRHDLGPGSPFLGDVTDIEAAASRAAALTRQLLSFARLNPSDPRVIDVSVVVGALERVLRRIVGSHLLVRAELEPGCFVRIDPGNFDQVLMNLAVNARDAMPGGGTLTITTERCADREEVRVRVTDNGAGIDPAVRARIFEPFFTTKQQGRGTGLGLATCYGIVQQAGGRISVISELGQGSCFELVFPRAAEPLPTAPTPILARPNRGQNPVVLLAEDEPRLRAMIVRGLERAGFRVLAAGSETEALKLIEGAPPSRC